MVIFGRSFTEADQRRVLWTVATTAVAAYPALFAALKSNWKAGVLAFLITIGSAAGSALKNWFLADSSPIK
jgi:hypothetical protein